MFLAATACELLGIRPFCAYQETALRQWIAEASNETVPHYGDVYNLLTNVVLQTMLWVLGCFPYTVLRQQVTSSNVLSFWSDVDPSDHANLLLLKRYTLTMNGELQRLSAHPPGPPRTYRESEVH